MGLRQVSQPSNLTHEPGAKRALKGFKKGAERVQKGARTELQKGLGEHTSVLSYLIRQIVYFVGQ